MPNMSRAEIEPLREILTAYHAGLVHIDGYQAEALDAAITALEAEQEPVAKDLGRCDIGLVGPVNGMGESDPKGPYHKLVLHDSNDKRMEARVVTGALEAELYAISDRAQAAAVPDGKDLFKAERLFGEYANQRMLKDGSKEYVAALSAFTTAYKLASAAPAPAKKMYPNDETTQAIHEAAKHLERVMRDHPYCDHVQVVKSYADIRHRAAAPVTGEDG